MDKCFPFHPLTKDPEMCYTVAPEVVLTELSSQLPEAEASLIIKHPCTDCLSFVGSLRLSLTCSLGSHSQKMYFQ